MLLDITMPVHTEMTVWPGDTPPQLTWDTRLEDGASATLSTWILGSHTGTHVDAPSHFIRGGGTLDDVSLESLIGGCLVVELTDVDSVITEQDLRDAHDWFQNPATRVLLKTRNSLTTVDGHFDKSFVSLDVSAATFLIARGVRTVGVDYLSVEAYVDETEVGDYDFPVHRTLLSAGVTVIEGLNLRDATYGRYRLICLPLRTVGTEAAPARAILER